MSQEPDRAAGHDDESEFPELSLRAGFALGTFDLSRLWIAYVGLGGSMSQADLEVAVGGRCELTAYEHDLIAQAMNEEFSDRGQDHPVAYADETEKEHHRPRRRHPLRPD